MAQQKRKTKGFWYWIFIGLWFEPLKWFVIGMFKLIKWFVTHLPGWIERTTSFVELRLERSGKRYSHTRIKNFVSLGFLLAIAASCFAMGAMAQSAPASESGPQFTDQPTNTATFLLLVTPTENFTPTSIFTPTSKFTSTSVITPTVTLPSNSLGIGCVPKTTLRQTGVVTKIVDGDTIHVEIEGVNYVVRYIGVDSPETGSAIASSATTYNTQLVRGQTVTLIKDVSETDRYDRLLRYVFVGNKFVNFEMVTSGFAAAGTWKPDVACDQEFYAAQTRAKSSQLGMWAAAAALAVAQPLPATAVIPTNPVAVDPTVVPTVRPSNCDAAYPDFCIPSPPPDLDCKDVAPHKRFRVLPPDPHHFDGDGDGIGCES
jgi:micrococcal nuclease